MRRADYLFILGGEVCTVCIAQIAPLLLLPLHDYATYSAIYLGFAAFITVKFAVLSDVWARQTRRDGAASVRPFYAVLTALALLAAATVGLLTAAVSRDLALAGPAAVAVAFALFRAGSAYQLIADGRARLVGCTEVAGAVAGGCAVAAAHLAGVFTAPVALACWALAPLVSILAARRWPRIAPHEVRAWFAANYRIIRVMVSEAAVKNLESVGTPYLVGAVGGALALALHRGASSLTYPVRLIVDAIRARIVTGVIPATGRSLAVFAGLGFAVGSAVAAGLVVAGRLGIGTQGVLGALAAHAVAVGAWTWVTAISSFLQFAARGAFEGRRLLSRRIWHTVVVLAGTAAVVIIFGPAAVIWGATIARVAAIPLWLGTSRVRELT